MARIKKYGITYNQPLSSYGTFILDTEPNSKYFKITEFKDTLTGGKNGFLIEGSEHLMQNTEIKIEDVTDGDIRRMLNKFEDFSHLTAQNIMSINPLTIDAESLAAKAGNYMQDKKITQLIVTKNNQYLGLIHLHDLYSEGII